MEKSFKWFAENLINFPNLHFLGYYRFSFAKRSFVFRSLGCSSWEMRHKILKNAAVEINCEMMHTLKSVSLLINLQEHSNVFRMNSRQNGSRGWRGQGMHKSPERPVCRMATLQFFQMLMNFRSLSEKVQQVWFGEWAKLASETHLCGLPPYRTGSKTLAVPIQNTFDNPDEPSAHSTTRVRSSSDNRHTTLSLSLVLIIRCLFEKVALPHTSIHSSL